MDCIRIVPVQEDRVLRPLRALVEGLTAEGATVSCDGPAVVALLPDGVLAGYRKLLDHGKGVLWEYEIGIVRQARA